MKLEQTFRTPEQRARIVETLLNAEIDEPHEIIVRPKRKRTPDQNSLAQVWYEQIARELQEDTAEGVKCECKLRFGVPILRAEDEEFREIYDRMIKGRYTYEEKLMLMRCLPVTSRMKRAQMARYLDQVQQEYALRGVILKSKNEPES